MMLGSDVGADAGCFCFSVVTRVCAFGISFPEINCKVWLIGMFLEKKFLKFLL